MAGVAYARDPAFLGAERESAGPQKTWGPAKRFYNENGITKATRALLAITL